MEVIKKSKSDGIKLELKRMNCQLIEVEVGKGTVGGGMRISMNSNKERSQIKLVKLRVNNTCLKSWYLWEVGQEMR